MLVIKFNPPLVRAALVKRYKRFLADVLLGETRDLCTVHCPNTGAMLGLTEPGTIVWLSQSYNLTRKFQYTWEIAEESRSGTWVGAHPLNANRLALQALKSRQITELAPYTSIQTEVMYGERSRVDFLLINTESTGNTCYLEVKNVHYQEKGVAFFPDSVTQRGTRHMFELAKVVQNGGQAAVLYVVQRNDCISLALADWIDPNYALAARHAFQVGVMPLAYSCILSEEGIFWGRPLPVMWDKISKSS